MLLLVLQLNKLYLILIFLYYNSHRNSRILYSHRFRVERVNHHLL